MAYPDTQPLGIAFNQDLSNVSIIAIVINLSYSLLDLILPKYTKLELQAANLKGFRASMNPRFEGGIPNFMDRIPAFIDNFMTF